MTPISRPKSLTEIVLEHLRNRIITGDLALGAALSERQLAEDLEVSKTPVREALSQLKIEGLVTIYPQKGAYVFTLAAQEVIQICEFRIAIEEAALKLSLQRNRNRLADDIDRIVEEMEGAQSEGDSKRYLQLDTHFHATFFIHCGNQYLRDSYERYVGKIAALRTHLSFKPLHTKLSLDEHITFRGLFRNGSEEEIFRVLEAHIGRTKDSYAASIQDIAAADEVRVAG